MEIIEIVCSSEENTCRTLKATYAKVSAANVVGGGQKVNYMASGVMYIYE